MTTALDAFKIHLNIIDADDDALPDALLQQKLDVAAAWVEAIVGTTFETVPPLVAEATRMLASHLLENREATIGGVTLQEVPFGVWGMLEPYRTSY